MALPTPPPTDRKVNRFMEPANKLSYYEDLYGERNEDEEFDRHPDDCEDETDSDDNEGKNKNANAQPGFFARFAKPNKKKPFVQTGYNGYGKIKTGQGKSNSLPGFT